MLSYRKQQDIRAALALLISEQAPFTTSMVLNRIGLPRTDAKALEEVGEFVKILYSTGFFNNKYEHKVSHGASKSLLCGDWYIPKRVPKQMNTTKPVNMISMLFGTNNETLVSQTMPAPAQPPEAPKPKERPTLNTYRSFEDFYSTVSKHNQYTVMGLGVSGSKDYTGFAPQTVKTNSIDPLSDMSYFVDKAGRICLLPNDLKKIDARVGDSLHIIAERRRISIVKTNPVLGGYQSLVEESGILRIQHNAIKEAGLSGVSIFEVVQEDDALHLKPTFKKSVTR